MRSLPLLLALLALTGCQVSASANLNTGPSKGNSDPEPPPSKGATDAQVARTAFVGVTQALALSEEASAKATCSCMAASVGQPGGAAFQWRGTPPTVGEDAMVVAISNDKTPCDNQAALRGPSIQGIEADGSNIIVTLEEPRPGIPVAHGAVFQRPVGEGSLIFRVARRLPYGHPLPGSATQVCRIPLGEYATGAKNSEPTRGASKQPVNTF